MRSVIAAGLLLLPSFASQKHPEIVRASLPGKEVDVAVDLKGFRSAGKESVPGKTILYGTIQDGKVSFSFLYDEGKEMETGAKFRDLWIRNFKLPGVRKFEAKDWACLDLVQDMPVRNFKDVHYHAFRGIPGLGLHVHVSATFSGESRTFSRDQFQDLVESIRIVDRRGEPTFPKAVGDVLTEASKHEPDLVAWVEKRCQEQPDDYAPHAALGMIGFTKEDPDRVLAGFGRAVELLGKKEKLGDDETFLLEDAEFSLGWAFYKKEKYVDALPHTQAAYRLAGQLKIRRLQGEATYALACNLALVVDAVQAVQYLKEAIAIEPNYKREAKTEKDFDRIRTNPEFKKLLGS
jgi:hypothetical protein